MNTGKKNFIKKKTDNKETKPTLVKRLVKEVKSLKTVAETAFSGLLKIALEVKELEIAEILRDVDQFRV